MNAILILIIVLFAMMIIVGGKQGGNSFLALCVNSFIIMLAVILMAGGFSPVWVALIASMIILATTIFFSTANMEVAAPAFIAALVVMVVLTLLIVYVDRYSAAAGFGSEDGEDLEGMSVAIGISLRQIGIAAGLMSTLGAIAEAAIAVAAGIDELDVDKDRAGIKQMGREITGTAINTLFFGFFGSFVGLFVWFGQLHYTLAVVLNNKIFVGELLDVLFSIIAVILTVPTTIWVVRRRQHSAKRSA